MPLKVTPYTLFKGKHWNELAPIVQQQIATGACDEVESIWKIFNILAKDFPPEEYQVIDTTVRLFTEPVLRADLPLLAKVWRDENTRKKDRLAELNVTEADLQSADKFAALLEAEGVEIERKQGKNGEIYAFAKTDQFMRDLLEDDNDRVRTLAEARLGVKSTLMQTRAATLGWMARRGPLPVYLRFAGAHTTRWSGGDGVNWQNLKRGSDLRRAILPPEGYLAAAPDESQVECRLLNVVAGQGDKVADFKLGRDPYVSVASYFYGYAVDRKNHPTERQVGKILELQAGYGSGAEKIRNTLRIAGITISSEEGLRARDAYRNTHPRVVDLWEAAENAIKRMYYFESFDWTCVKVVCDRGKGTRRIILPNGAPLIYDTLEDFNDNETGENYWRIKTRHGWSKLYGAKLVENLIQALARVIVSQAMIRITKLGYRIVNTEHDSLWIVIPKDNAEQHLKVCMDEMKRTPSWLPGIPLDCEGSLGERYSK